MKKTITLTHFSIDHGMYAVRLSMFSIFFIFSFLFSAPLYSESNLRKFDSIDIDYRAAGIDKKVLLEQFEKNPSAYRKKVERHKRERFIILTSAHEKAISKQFVDGMIKKNILLHDAKAKARVNKILVRLVKVMQKHYQTTSVKFYIVDTKGINACCLPDGTIILFRGLLEKLNDNELAWVMAHELSHGAAHHSAEMITEKLITDQKIEDFIPNKGSNDLKKSGINIAESLANLCYNKIQEYEADRLALYYMNKAGFDMQSAITTSQKFIKITEKDPEWTKWLSTHPHPKKRLKHVKKNIARLKKDPEYTWERKKDALMGEIKLNVIELLMDADQE